MCFILFIIKSSHSLFLYYLKCCTIIIIIRTLRIMAMVSLSMI